MISTFRQLYYNRFLVLFLDLFLWFAFWIKATLNTCALTGCDLAVGFTLTFANIFTFPLNHSLPILGSYSIKLSHKAVPLSLKEMSVFTPRIQLRRWEKDLAVFGKKSWEHPAKNPCPVAEGEGRFIWQCCGELSRRGERRNLLLQAGCCSRCSDTELSELHIIKHIHIHSTG